MGNRKAILGLGLIIFILYACNGIQTLPSSQSPTPSPSGVPVSTATLGPTSTGGLPNMLFIDAEPPAGAPTPSSQDARTRFVKFNQDLLLDANGQALSLPSNAEITLNLFPDVTFTGVIERVENDGNGYTWVGHLKDVDNSALFIVFTAGVFIAHFASPAGIYEVSSAGDDVYKLIKIDQTKLPGGG